MWFLNYRHQRFSGYWGLCTLAVVFPPIVLYPSQAWRVFCVLVAFEVLSFSIIIFVPDKGETKDDS